MKIFWVDLETSGLDSARHGIISLSYAVELDGQEVAAGELRSSCEGKEIDDSALDINHFSRGQLLGFPPPREMYYALLDIFGQYVKKYDHHDKFMVGGYNCEGLRSALPAPTLEGQPGRLLRLVVPLRGPGSVLPPGSAGIHGRGRTPCRRQAHRPGPPLRDGHHRPSASWDLKMTRFVLSVELGGSPMKATIVDLIRKDGREPGGGRNIRPPVIKYPWSPIAKTLALWQLSVFARKTYRATKRLERKLEKLDWLYDTGG